MLSALPPDGFERLRGVAGRLIEIVGYVNRDEFCDRRNIAQSHGPHRRSHGHARQSGAARPSGRSARNREREFHREKMLWGSGEGIHRR
jgi:hypothetical protein